MSPMCAVLEWFPSSLLRYLVALGAKVVLRDIGASRRHGEDFIANWGLITVDFNRLSYPQWRMFPRPHSAAGQRMKSEAAAPAGFRSRVNLI